MYFLPGQKEWFGKEKWKLRGRWSVLTVVILLGAFIGGEIYHEKRVLPGRLERARAQLVAELEQETKRAKALSEENADLYGVIGEAFGKNAKLMIETWRAKQKTKAGK